MGEPREESQGNEQMSVAEMVRCAAEQAQLEQMLPGYVLQPGTGLYYNAQSGYYYDKASQLFFHTSTQKYYFYDAEAGEFKIWGEPEAEKESGMEFTNLKYRRLAKRYKIAESRSSGQQGQIMDSTAFEVVMDLLDKLEINEKKETRGKRSYFSLFQNTDGPEEPEILGDVIDLTEETNSAENQASNSSSDSDSDSSVDDSFQFEGDQNDPEFAELMRRRRREYRAALHAPCVRLMEQPEGILHVVTIMGGTIGRMDCDVNLDDVNASRCHAKIMYVETKKKKSGKKSGKYAYFVEDMESRNGTTVNGTKSLQGFPTELNHMDRIQIASKILVAHIHQGSNTCPGCEQGLVQTSAAISGRQQEEEIQCLSGPGKEKQRKKELKNMKQKYGLQGSSTNALANIDKRKYTDRAETRRVTVGSEPNIRKVDAAPAASHKKLSSENKGFKMLEKMGWKEGKSLGKTMQGIKEPVNLKQNLGTMGLGAGPPSRVGIDTSFSQKRKKEILMKTQQRYRKIKTPPPPGTEPSEAPPPVLTLRDEKQMEEYDDDIIMEKQIIRNINN